METDQTTIVKKNYRATTWMWGILFFGIISAAILMKIGTVVGIDYFIGYGLIVNLLGLAIVEISISLSILMGWITFFIRLLTKKHISTSHKLFMYVSVVLAIFICLVFTRVLPISI